MIIELPYNFELRHYQRDLFKAHFIDRKRFMVCVLHRRAGKTLGCLNFVLAAMLNRVGLYIHAFPELGQARLAVWEGSDNLGRRYLDYIPRQLIKRIDNRAMSIEIINGSILRYLSSSRYNQLRGGNPIGIILDEYSETSPAAWETISPILAENDGWAMFPFTPKGMNHSHRLYENALNNEDFFVQKYDISQTKKIDGSPVVTEKSINIMRATGIPEERIQQEYYCSFESGNVGSIYGKQLTRAFEEGRVKDFPIDPNIPVMTFWDIGWHDKTAIWFLQAIGPELRLINYYENFLEYFAHYRDYILEFSQKHNIKYKAHYFPHDMYNQDMMQETSRVQQAMKVGIMPQRVPGSGSKHSKAEGIDAVRRLFDRMIFNKSMTKLGVDCIRQFHYEEKPDGSFRDEAKHDWSSHGCDALRYLAMTWEDRMGLKPEPNRILTYTI